ncbi:uncharacterized protein LOC135123338 isoform X3 [Zophobas morio]|uniref:uncharacterized protein LOC135123338 isoform X3 n=1 Tax=Zophobas morio TaxID=2755281 RepID=UPI0030838726
MSSSDSEDSYDHEDYYRKYCSCDERAPPLIKKKSRLISAAAHGQLEIFSDLLDSPKWYNVRDVSGNNLLQIAVIQERIKVFDYLLSIPDFPLDFKNKEGETALALALDDAANNDIWRDEYITYELIKKGACIDEVCFEGYSPLHRAIERQYHKSAKLLIERGADVNCLNFCHKTPLDMSVYMRQSELVIMLLAYGAQPVVSHFALSVLHCNSFEAQQTISVHL